MALLSDDDVFGSATSGKLMSDDDVFGAKPKKQNKGIAGDLITDLKRGVEGIPGALTGLADIPVAAITGQPMVSQAADKLGGITGFTPSKWAKDAEAEYSPGRQAANAEIDAAWKDGTATDIAGAYLKNPAKTLGSIVESAPSMLVGGLAARGIAAASKIAPVVAAGIGEGGVMAGQQMDQLTTAEVDPRTAAAAATGTGIAGGVIGAMGGKIAQKMGVIDPDTAIAGGAARNVSDATGLAAVKETGKRVLGGGLSEGVFEELPQSIAEQGLSNLAQDKPITEGMARAGVEGTLAGFGMGAAFNALPGAKYVESKRQPADEQPEIAGLLPAPSSRSGTPGDQIVAADAERQAAIDAADANAAAIYAARDAFEQQLRQNVTIINEPAPLQQRIDDMLNVDAGRMTKAEHAAYEKELTAAFNEQIGIRHDANQREVPFTMGEYLDAQVSAENAARSRPLKQNAIQQSDARLQQVADEETSGYVAPIIPVVGTLSAAANLAVQSGAHAQTQMQQAMQTALAKQNTSPDGKAGTPAGPQKEATAPSQGPLAEVASAAAPNISTQAPNIGGDNAAQSSQMAAQAPQANAPQAVPAGQFDVSQRTDGQLAYLSQNGKPGWKEAATAEIQRRGMQSGKAPVSESSPAAPVEKRGIKTVDRWTAEELQARLDRGNLSPESEQRLRDELAKRPAAKKSASKASVLSVGKTPNAAEPVTVRNGVVYVGDYPAIDYETEADITVPDGATSQQIADALRNGGAIGSNRIFGLKQDEQKAQEKPAVDDPIGWTRMTTVDREALVSKAGWSGKIRGMNLGGVRVAAQAWDAMTEANRAKLIEANKTPVKNEAPDATAVPAETTEPKQEPIKNRVEQTRDMVDAVSQPKTDIATEANQDNVSAITPQRDNGTNPDPANGNKPQVKNATVAAEKQAESKPEESIGDFGEKIGGAKKDLWTGYKDKLNSAESLDIKSEPLSKSWPAPDYEALIESGVDSFVVAFIRSARDSIPRKPTATWKLKSWSGGVELLRDTSKKLIDGELSATQAKELLQKAGSVSRGMRDIAGRIELYQLVGHRQSLDGISLSNHFYSLYKGKENVNLWAVEKEAKATAFSNMPAEIVTGSTKQEVLDKFKALYDKVDFNKKADRAVTFDLYSQGGKFYVGKKMGRNITQLSGPFATIKETRAYRDENHDELVARLEKAKEIPKPRRDKNEPRVGEDMRDGQDVTPEMFAESFGFKGVEFGNWVEQKKRQKDLNESFDALMDMAAILNVPPKALSLNGQLGLAFGARGAGGIDPAAAHYERDFVVINLTKKEGAGSLGHEWFHALDNYFSRLRGKGSDMITEALDVSLAGRGSDFIANTDVRKEMIQAFGRVVGAIKMTALRERSAKLDNKRSKAYWTTTPEMSARAFESYLISKLQDQNASNDYLANIVDDQTWKAAESLGFELDDSYPYPTAGEMPLIREAFDKFFQAVETKETERGVALYNITGNTDSLSPSDQAIYGMASEGKSAAEILKFIASASRNPFYRQLAKLLQKTGIAPSVTVGTMDGWKFNAGNDKKYAAAYNPKANTVALFRPAAAERNMLHELMHAATLQALSKKGLAAGQMKALFAHVQKSGALKGMYGMSDVDEFVAEAFTNPKFQDALKKVSAPKTGVSTLSTAWQWFVRIVRGVLGIPQGQESALSQAIEIGLGVMRENMALNDNARPKQEALMAMPAVPIRFRTDGDFDTVKARARADYGMLQKQSQDSGEGAMTTDGKNVKFSTVGFKKTAQHAADRRVLAVIANAKKLIESAMPLYSTTPEKPEQGVRRYHYYGVKANFGLGGDALVLLSIKESTNGEWFYDADATDVEIARAVYSAALAGRTKTGAGDAESTAPKGRLASWLAGVNEGERVRYNVADEGWAVAEPSKMDDVIYALQDKQIDMKRVVQSIMNAGKKIADRFNPYLQEELFHGRAAKGVKDFLDFELRPLLTEMQKAGVDMGDFEEYLWNRHAEERNRQIAKINPDMQDGGSGIETAKARAYLAGLTAEQRKTYESLAAKVEAINKASQKVLVESGLEKQSTIDAWNGAYRHYVPLQREDVDSGNVGTGKGFSVRGSSTKRAMGSGRQVVDIIANLTMQRERNIVRAEKNRVSNALLGLATQNPNPDFWKVDQAPKERIVEEKAIYIVVDADGNKVDEFTRMDDAERLANKTPGSTIDQRWGDRVTERVTPGFKSRDNVLLTRVNGEDHYVIFNERDERAMRMAAAMKNLDVDNLGRVLSIVGKATRYLSSINTQYNPVFGVINLIRDAQGALINLSSTPLAGEQKRVLGYTVDALRGIYADIRAHRKGNAPSSNWSKLFEEFQKEGGATGYRDQYANAEARAEAIKSELEQFKDGKAKQFTRGVFGWLSDYNETMENATRLAAYKAAKEKGMSNQQAASLAKNITVNFNRKGQMATQVGALYAFFNASVQGTARIAETLFEQHGGNIKNVRLSKTGKKIVLGGIMLGSMQAMLLAAAGFDDDEPPEFVRERNLILPIGNGKYLTLAMPLGLHVIPGMGRIATEFVLSGGKYPLKRIAAFGSMFADAFNPIGSAGWSLQTITPSIVDPFAALAENKDFTGKEIYREDFNKLNPTPGHARAKDVATIWSRYISEVLNFMTGGTEFKPGMISPSPDAIDYLIGQVTGGVGREAGKVAQTYSASSSGEDLPLYKIPLVGRFVGDTAGQSGQSAKFYEAIKQINMHEAEYKGLIKSGRSTEAKEYLAENPAVRLIMAGNYAEQAVRKLRTMKRDLVENDADQEKIRAIDDRITATMRQFNERAGLAI